MANQDRVKRDVEDLGRRAWNIQASSKSRFNICVKKMTHKPDISLVFTSNEIGSYNQQLTRLWSPGSGGAGEGGEELPYKNYRVLVGNFEKNS